MKFKDVEICCPLCKGELYDADAMDERSLSCPSCDRAFPVIFGIPDLRVFADPYIDIESDRAKGALLASQTHDLTFEETIRFYYQITPAVSAHQAEQFTRGLLSGMARCQTAIATWEHDGNLNTGGLARPILDIGCGTAPLLSVLGHRYAGSVGVDIAFRWLVIAKKRLQESNVDLPLICACAEALPFPGNVFHRVVADSALEHFRGQAEALEEFLRVLRPNGHLSITTPNRYSVGPDPHLNLWAGGYLPERLLTQYALKRGTVPPRRQLLGKGSIQRQLRAAGFDHISLDLPDVPSEQRDRFGWAVRLLVDTYQTMKRLPGFRQVLFTVGPLLVATARKSSVAADREERAAPEPGAASKATGTLATV
jgi:ubiquinone/menaquinone biosynthesis C-methylase UbiE/uncharacterized protein YbaR (Trm112 family)